MGEARVQGDDLKKLVKLGKKKTLNFAFCPGKKDDHTVVIDKRKKGEVLSKIAKKEGDGAKVAFGTFEVKGKVMELTCERVVPNMAKVLKKYLKSQKVRVNVVIMDPTGKVLESDIEDLPDDPSWDEGIEDDDADEAIEDRVEQEEEAADGGSSDEAANLERQRAALVARLKAVQPSIAGAEGDIAEKLKKAAAQAVAQIKSGDLAQADRTVAALEGAAAKLSQAKGGTTEETPAAKGPDLRVLAARAASLKEAIAGLPPAVAEKLAAALANAVKMLKAGDLAAANLLLGKIEDGVNRVAAKATAAAESPPPPEPEPSPEAARWEAARDRLQPLVDRLMQEGRGDLAAINRFFNYAKDQAEAGVYDKALAAAARTADLVKQAQAMPGSAAAKEAAESIPANVVGYTRSRLGWIKTRGDLRKELQTLKAEIDKASAGIEGLEDVPAKSGVLFEYLDDIDTSLEDTLERLVETPDGEDREALKTTARGIIDDYRDVLDSAFFQAVDDNGFVRTNIRAAALASLQQVSAALDK